MKKAMSRFLIIIFMMAFLQSSTIVAKQCNDLIFIIDSFGDERIDGRTFSMGSHLIHALYEKVAPTVVSTNVVNNVCYFKDIKQQYQKALDENNHWRRQKNSVEKDQNLARALTIINDIETKYKNFIIRNGDRLDLVDLSDEDWLCYMHKSGQFILFVPKVYIAKRVGPNIFDITDRMQACGFKTTDLNKVNNLSPQFLLRYIQSKKNTSSADIIDSIKSIFITKNPIDNAELPALQDIQSKENISSTYVTHSAKSLFAAKKFSDTIEFPTWNFYIVGHGGPKNEAVAGLTFEAFIRLMGFFNTGINTNFVHYTTCFGGGSNQTFVNEKLQALNVDYIVVAEGNNEVSTSNAFEHYKDNRGRTIVVTDRFTTFFNLLESFFGDSAYVKKDSLSKEWQKAPIAAIVKSTVSLQGHEHNQPFVRIPSAGVFTVLNVDKKIKILTHSVVKAYELENRTIDCFDREITTIFVYPEHIKVPLKKRKGQAIVSPNSQSIKKLEKLHIFEKIESDYFTVSDFLKLNSTLSKITFIVKNFTYKGTAPVENVIIQMKDGMYNQQPGTISVGVSVAFTIGNYWYDTQFYKNGFNVTFGNSFPDVGIYRLDTLATYIQTRLPALHPNNVIDMFFNKTDSRRPMANGNTFMQDIINAFEKTINKDVEVQKPGELKKVLLLQRLQVLEDALTPEVLSAQQEYLKKNNKPAGDFMNSVNKYKVDLDNLETDFDQIVYGKQLNNQELADLISRLKKLNELLAIALKSEQLPKKEPRPLRKAEQPAQDYNPISSVDEKELKQAMVDYKEDKNRLQAEQVINTIAKKYPKDSTVKLTLNEKQKFDDANVQLIKQPKFAEPVKFVKQKVQSFSPIVQPKVVIQMSAQEKKELRQALIDYEKPHNSAQVKMIAENIIKRYADKYPHNKLVSSMLRKKKRFDEENLKK